MVDAEGDPSRRHVTVIGAGIIGICCALYLQHDGHPVTVIDWQAPGEGCSKGNMGIFAIDHCVPNATPDILAEVPGMLFDPLGPLTLRWSYLPSIAPWLLRFVRASFRDRIEPISVALHRMNSHAMEAYQPLIQRAGAAGMVRKSGWLMVYESASAFEKAKRIKIGLRQRRGVRVEILDVGSLREHEPALNPKIEHGVLFPDVAQCTDPHRFVRVLAEDFLRNGGGILKERVTGFTLGERGPKEVRTDSASHEVDLLVLAAGAYSREMAKQLGSKIPLDTERGYHNMLPDPNVQLGVPVVSGDLHCAITPMEGGLRVGGSVEFAGLHAPPNYARADKLLTVARRILPGLNDSGASQWMGCRPSLPDSLPVISRSPCYSSVYFAFGHGQLGLTNAAVTGKLIAEMVAGRDTTIDVTPYGADRFWLT
ncbi:MAG: FAD-binding oxidoreductase [SAR324 cluster bacterium]|nr:FAD-binding oxidoreductase [SAR324 cluster bacterium]